MIMPRPNARFALEIDNTWGDKRRHAYTGLVLHAKPFHAALSAYASDLQARMRCCQRTLRAPKRGAHVHQSIA